MKQIYAIRNGDEFQELDLEVDDILDFSPENVSFDDVIEFHTRNTAMKSWWKTPVTQYINLTEKPNAAIPDIRHWTDSALVLSPKAYRLLGSLLEPSGEFLPVLIDEETYHLFNCFTLGEADEEKCKFEYHEGMKLGIDQLVFKSSATDNLIWKTPVESCLTLFCSDRLKEIVESYELTGIWFDTKLIEFVTSDSEFE